MDKTFAHGAIVTWRCKDVNLEIPLSPDTRPFKLTNTVDDHPLWIA